MDFYGQVDASSTLRIFFTTHAGTGAAVAPNSAFEAADVRIYKDGSATQRSSEAGYTMTSPFDSVTGLHLLSVDLSDNTDAGFYAAGSRYTVVLVPDETVDGVAVVRTLADFKIGPEAANVTQWLGTTVATPGTAGVPSVDSIRVSTSATAADNLETAALAYSATRGLAGTALPAAAADAAGGLIVSDAGGLDADAQLVTKINDILTDTGTTLQAELDGIQADTEDIQAKIGTPAGASVSADVAAVKVDTAAILVDTGTTLQAELDGIQADTEDLQSKLGTPSDLGSGATVAANLADIEAQTDDLAAFISRLTGTVIAQGTIGSTGNSTTALHLTGLTYGDDEINDYLLVILDVSTGEYHSRWVEDWADTGDLATVATLPFTPQNATDTYWVLPVRQDVSGGSGLDAAGVRAAVGLASANLDTQLGDLPTNAELSTALGSADDAVLAAIAALNNLSQANIRTAVGLGSANLDTQLGDLPTNSELTAALAAADDAVLAAIAALNNLSAAGVRTAVGLGSANLDTQLADLPTNAELATALAAADDAVLAAIAALNNLSAAGVRTALGLASANLDTQLDALPTNAELATALGTADDAILAAVAALNNLSSAQAQTAAAAALTAYDPPTKAEMDTAIDAVPTAIENADALLKRDMSAVTGEAARSPLNALRFLRNKWLIAAGILSVKKEDDSTEAWSGPVTTDADAEPITGMDPG